jgi:mono/diheme cytochrome c family protein
MMQDWHDVRHRGPWCFLGLALCAVVAGPAFAQQPAVPPDHAERLVRGQEVFSKHVRQLLTDRCLKCHGGDKTRGGLDLTTRETLLKGGDNGPAIVPFKAKDSRLYKLVAHLEEPHMPSKMAKLADADVARIAAWIDLGAPYDKPLLAKADPAAKKPMVVTDEDRRFWSFQPVKRPPLPKVKNEAWCQTPLDRFLLASMEEKGLTPNPPVDRRRLVRRAYFDLIGLPPTPEEVERFVNDAAPNAYGRLIDRLLENPHFGERWARHWLDVARFAESHGYEQDYDRPTAYPYRDFVIKAFNQDLPYDVFVKWQIAGDEIEPDNPLALMATGFLAAGVHSTQITANQVEKERYDELDDMARTTGTAMLGLTVGCARCHDHKFDPIPTADYYRLLSTFTTTVRSEMDIDLDPKRYKEAKTKFDAEHKALVGRLQDYETGRLSAPLDDPTTDPHWRRLNQLVVDHAKTAPKPTILKALISSEGVPAVRTHTQGGDFLEHTHFLTRGDPNQKGDIATQGFLQVLERNPDREKRWLLQPPPSWHTSYRRRALADWLTDTEYGAGHLLARVIVNRLWQHHFGRGIVATPSDFGYQGDKPTHPELLDWLADELIRGGWRLKPIHKLIMTSAAYAQGADLDKSKVTLDPDNKLVWRRPRMRLEAEIIRDALLAVSGTLDERQFGPGTLDPNHKRRSIYFFVKRSQLVPSMILFDAPDTLQGLEQRASTIIAPQALMLMNNAAVREYARNFAKRLGPAADKSLDDAVRSGYAIALARTPRPEELADSVQFLREQMESYKADGKANGRELALADFCQVLMELNEFIYVD